jgi:hypothetical protein
VVVQKQVPGLEQVIQVQFFFGKGEVGILRYQEGTAVGLLVGKADAMGGTHSPADQKMGNIDPVPLEVQPLGPAVGVIPHRSHDTRGNPLPGNCNDGGGGVTPELPGLLQKPGELVGSGDAVYADQVI